jgi:hypothetical protein
MKKFLVFWVAFVTTTLLCVSCLKDKYEVVQDISTLKDTWWVMYSTKTVYFDEKGKFVRESYVGQDMEGLSGWSPGRMYLAEDFIGRYSNITMTGNSQYHWLYSELEYIYNPSAKQIRIGDDVYGVEEFSADRIELTLKGDAHNSAEYKSYEETMVYIPFQNDDSWEEHRRNMDLDNAYVQYMHRPIRMSVYVYNEQGENLLDPKNKNAYSYEDIVVTSMAGDSFHIVDKEDIGTYGFFPYVAEDDNGEKRLEIYVSHWTVMQSVEKVFATIKWPDDREDIVAYKSEWTKDPRYNYVEYYYGYTFDIEFYLNGEVVQKSDSPNMEFRIVR